MDASTLQTIAAVVASVCALLTAAAVPYFNYKVRALEIAAADTKRATEEDRAERKEARAATDRRLDTVVTMLHDERLARLRAAEGLAAAPEPEPEA